jgi:drug/metabolite transporter (DMT)-like permease
MPATEGPRAPQTLGLAAVATTMVLWGTSAVVIKAVPASGLATATYRLWFAIVPMLLTLTAPAVRQRLDANWLRSSLIGGLLFALHQALYFVSLKLTSVTNVTIIGALQPALVLMLAGPMFGETATRSSIVWSAVAFAGTTLVVFGSDHPRASSYVGDAMAVANLFAFTSYFLASKRFRERLHAWDYVVGMTTVSGVAILTLALVTRQDLAPPSGGALAALAWLAVFPGTLGHVLTNWAHAYVPAFVSSMILLAVPVVGAAAAHFWLAESIHPMQIAGGAIVLLAIAVIIWTTQSAGRTAGRSTQRAETEVMAEATAFTEAP